MLDYERIGALIDLVGTLNGCLPIEVKDRKHYYINITKHGEEIRCRFYLNNDLLFDSDNDNAFVSTESFIDDVTTIIQNRMYRHIETDILIGKHLKGALGEDKT